MGELGEGGRKRSVGRGAERSKGQRTPAPPARPRSSALLVPFDRGGDLREVVGGPGCPGMTRRKSDGLKRGGDERPLDRNGDLEPLLTYAASSDAGSRGSCPKTLHIAPQKFSSGAMPRESASFEMGGIVRQSSAVSGPSMTVVPRTDREADAACRQDALSRPFAAMVRGQRPIVRRRGKTPATIATARGRPPAVQHPSSRPREESSLLHHTDALPECWRNSAG